MSKPKAPARFPLISPSILSCDLLHLEKEIKDVEAAGADWLHIDVMDGHFVPNLSFGIPIIEAAKKVASLPLDVHIMVTNPEELYKPCIEAGADILTFHIEATKDPLSLAKKIKNMGARAGLSINPNTPIRAITDDVLALMDLFLIMTVHP